MTPRVYVVRTGLANLASVLAGFRRAGAEPIVTQSPEDIAGATHVVLPGVGAFGAAMENLERHGLLPVLRERLELNRPTMAVCLGLQLLFETSAETPGVRGLGFVPGGARQLPSSVRVPQLGWNQIGTESGCRFLRGGYAYFANSFCIDTPPPGWKCGTVEHGIRLVACMERGNLLACQFHPELSGTYGLELLKRWLETKEENSQC